METNTNTHAAQHTDGIDLSGRIETVVGKLVILAPRLGDADAAVLDEAMSLLAGVQEALAWEPELGLGTASNAELAAQLGEMSTIGPRPPATVKLLADSALALRSGWPQLARIGKFVGSSTDYGDYHRIDLTLRYRIYGDMPETEEVVDEIVVAAREGRLQMVQR
jgi:hypothetical protein